MSPEAIAAMIELLQTLEPPMQQAIAGLVEKLHHKKFTAQDYLDLAAKLVNPPSATPPTA